MSSSKQKQESSLPPLQKIIKKSALSKGLKDKMAYFNIKTPSLQFASIFEDINELLKQIISNQSIQGDQLKQILQEIEQKIKQLNYERSRVQPKLAEISFGHIMHMIDIYQSSDDPNHKYLSFYLMKIWIKNLQYSEQYVQALLKSIDDNEPYQKEIFAFLQELSIEKPDVLDQILKIANTIIQNLTIVDQNQTIQEQNGNQQQKNVTQGNKGKSQEELLEFILNILQKFESQSLEKDLLSLISKYTPQDNEAYHQIILDNFLSNENNYETYFNICIEFIKKGLEAIEGQTVIGYIKRTEQFYLKIKNTARRGEFLKSLICPILILRQTKNQNLVKVVRQLWKPTIFSDKEGQEKILEYLEDIISYLSSNFTGVEEERILMAADSMTEIIDKVMKEQADVDRFNNEKKISILTNIQMGCFMNKMIKYDRVISFYQKFVNKFNLTKNYQIQGFFRGDWKNLNALDVNAVSDYFEKQQMDIKAEISQKYHKFTAGIFLLFLLNKQTISEDIEQKFQSITNAPPGLYKMNHSTIHGFLQTYPNLPQSKSILEANIYHYFKLERLPQLKSLEQYFGQDYIKNLIKEKANDVINLQTYLQQTDSLAVQKNQVSLTSQEQKPTNKVQREYTYVTFEQKRTLFASINVPLQKPSSYQSMSIEESTNNQMEIEEQVKPFQTVQTHKKANQEVPNNQNKNLQNTSQAQKQQKTQQSQSQQQQKPVQPQQPVIQVDNSQKSQLKTDSSPKVTKLQNETKIQNNPNAVVIDKKQTPPSSQEQLELQNKESSKSIVQIIANQVEEELQKPQEEVKQIEEEKIQPEIIEKENPQTNQIKEDITQKQSPLLPVIEAQSQKQNQNEKPKLSAKVPSTNKLVDSSNDQTIEQAKTEIKDQQQGHKSEEKQVIEKMEIEQENKETSKNLINKPQVQNNKEQPTITNPAQKVQVPNLELKKPEISKISNQANTPTLSINTSQVQGNKPTFAQQKVQTPTQQSNQTIQQNKPLLNNEGQSSQVTNPPTLPALNKPISQMTMKEKAQLKMKNKKEEGAASNPQTPTAAQGNSVIPNLSTTEQTVQQVKTLPQLGLKPLQQQVKSQEQLDKPQQENKPSLESLKKPSLPSLSVAKKKPESQVSTTTNQIQTAENMEIEIPQSDQNIITPQNSENNSTKPALSFKPKIQQKNTENLQQGEKSPQQKQQSPLKSIQELNKIEEGEITDDKVSQIKSSEQLQENQASLQNEIQNNNNKDTSDNDNDKAQQEVKVQIEQNQVDQQEQQNDQSIQVIQNDESLQQETEMNSPKNTEQIQEEVEEDANEKPNENKDIEVEEQTDMNNENSSIMKEEKEGNENIDFEEEQNDNNQLGQQGDNDQEQNLQEEQIINSGINEQDDNLENKVEEEQNQTVTIENKDDTEILTQAEQNENKEITEENADNANDDDQNQIEEEGQQQQDPIQEEEQQQQEIQEDNEVQGEEQEIVDDQQENEEQEEKGVEQAEVEEGAVDQAEIEELPQKQKQDEEGDKILEQENEVQQQEEQEVQGNQDAEQEQEQVNQNNEKEEGEKEEGEEEEVAQVDQN